MIEESEATGLSLEKVHSKEAEFEGGQVVAFSVLGGRQEKCVAQMVFGAP